MVVRDDLCSTSTLTMSARNVLQKHFDWIGATEQWNSITLPLLAWLLFGDSQALIHMRAKIVASNLHGVQKLSNQTITSESLDYLESINRRVKRLWAEEVLVSSTGGIVAQGKS